MVQAREEMGRAREEAGRAMQWAGTEPDICQALEKWMMGMEEWVQAVGKKEEQAVAVMQAILKRLGAVEAGLVRSQGMQRRGKETHERRVMDEVMMMRDDMKRMRVGQGEMARLIQQMGSGVGDVGAGMAGMGSTVRAIQRDLEARAKEQRRVADLVTCLQQEGAVMGQVADAAGSPGGDAGQAGRRESPPGTGRKQKGRGGRAGAGRGERRKLQFGEEEEGGLWSRSQALMRDMDEMERDDEEQEKQRGQMRDEQEQEDAEETIDEMYERMMKEVDEQMIAEKEAQVAADEAAVLAATAAEKVRQQRESRERVMMRKRRGEESVIESVIKVKMDDEEEASRVSWMCPCVLCDGEVKFWVRVRDGLREERAKQEEGVCSVARCGTKVRLRCWELVPQEGDGGERYEWEVKVVQEEMRVQSEPEGDEKREEEKREVQPFGCASTSS